MAEDGIDDDVAKMYRRLNLEDENGQIEYVDVETMEESVEEEVD